MHRLRPSLCWQAHRISPLAARLLPVCRTIPSCLAELFWIREHVRQHPTCEPARVRLRRMCDARATGQPLQQVLGVQPFGHVRVKCEPGVLVPRNDTETWAVELGARLVQRLSMEHERIDRRETELAGLEDDSTGLVRRYSGRIDDMKRLGGSEQAAERPDRMRSRERARRERVYIVDFCTGSGCVALELAARLRAGLADEKPPFTVWGVDVDAAAVQLARRNKTINAEKLGVEKNQSYKIVDIEKLGCPYVIKQAAKQVGNDEPYRTWIGQKGKAFKKALELYGVIDYQKTLVMSGVSFSVADVFSPELDLEPGPVRPAFDAPRAEHVAWAARVRERKEVRAVQAPERIDVMVANPPYLSERAYQHDVERSVRNWEPRLALVPWAYEADDAASKPLSGASATSSPPSSPPSPSSSSSLVSGAADLKYFRPPAGKSKSAMGHAKYTLQAWLKKSGTQDWLFDLGPAGDKDAGLADVFYARLLQIACRTRPKLIVFEVGGDAQAARVLRMLHTRFPSLMWSEDLHRTQYPTNFEVWRDNLHNSNGDGGQEKQRQPPLANHGLASPLREVGTGEARALVINLPGEWVKRYQQLTRAGPAEEQMRVLNQSRVPARDLDQDLRDRGAISRASGPRGERGGESFHSPLNQRPAPPQFSRKEAMQMRAMNRVRLNIKTAGHIAKEKAVQEARKKAKAGLQKE